MRYILTRVLYTLYTLPVPHSRSDRNLWPPSSLLSALLELSKDC